MTFTDGLVAAGAGKWQIRAFWDNDGEKEVCFDAGSSPHRLNITMKKA